MENPTTEKSARRPPVSRATTFASGPRGLRLPSWDFASRTGLALSKSTLTQFLLLLLASTIGGCSHFRTFDLPAEPAHSQGNYQEKLGLTVAAEILVDPVAAEYQFGPELRRAGYLPLLIFVENRGPNSFELDRSDLVIVLESGESFTAVPPREVLQDIRRSTLPALLLAPLILPPMILYRQIEDYNLDMARNLDTKAFRSGLRVEEGDKPLVRVAFFRDPTQRLQREYGSAVLRMMVEVEGARPDGEAHSLLAADGLIKRVTSRQGTTTEAPTGGGVPSRPVVGRRVTFTVSLSWQSF